jgi:pyrroline-5-carboxylate reductase
MYVVVGKRALPLSMFYFYLSFCCVCCIVIIHSGRRALFKEKFNATSFDNPKLCVQGVDMVILACKPQNIEAVSKDLKGHISKNSVVLSILAGTSMETLMNKLDTKTVVRSMPNTPAAILEGMTVWTASPATTDVQKKLVSQVLAALGEELMVDEEQYLDMATALSGSGPAYVLLLMESMIETVCMNDMSIKVNSFQFKCANIFSTYIYLSIWFSND